MELVTNVPTEEDMGTDSVRSVCFIMRVDNPSVGRASRKVVHEGAVGILTEGAGGRTLVLGGTACGGVVMAPAGKTPKTKGRRRKVKGVHRVLPDREEVVREDVPCGSDAIAESL